MMPGEHHGSESRSTGTSGGGGTCEACQDRLEALEARVAELEEALAEAEARLDAQAKPDTVKWLVSQVQGGTTTDTDPEEMTTLERYAQMPVAERVEVLPASEVRATFVFENWLEWSHTGPYGDEFVTSAQAKPATLRVLLREVDPTVSVSAGQDLRWVQVHRAMRACHRLTEGALRYEEDHTPPDNTAGEACHALILESPGEMPTLPRE
jgi:hypothetical protein